MVEVMNVAEKNLNSIFQNSIHLNPEILNIRKYRNITIIVPQGSCRENNVNIYEFAINFLSNQNVP